MSEMIETNASGRCLACDATRRAARRGRRVRPARGMRQAYIHTDHFALTTYYLILYTYTYYLILYACAWSAAKAYISY